MSMIELRRYSESGEGEDEIGRPILINPAMVSCMFAANEPGVTIVRMLDGRGFKIVGEFEAVRNVLGFVTPSEVGGAAVN